MGGEPRGLVALARRPSAPAGTLPADTGGGEGDWWLKGGCLADTGRAGSWPSSLQARNCAGVVRGAVADGYSAVA